MPRRVMLFLGGGVMTGRGIDQALPCSCAPHLFEPHVSSARDYIALAERAHGPISLPVDYTHVWGEALPILQRRQPTARIINLETSITTSEDAVDKGINYRMHPGNVAVLSAAGIDCCVIANNHVLDWGEAGLIETLDTLAAAGIRCAGAGRDLRSAEAPAVHDHADGCVRAARQRDDLVIVSIHWGSNRVAARDDALVLQTGNDSWQT